MEIELIDVNVEFKDDEKSRKVLRGLNLRVESGDFVAILGPSGCGKTTLLKYIAGFLPGRKASSDIFMIHQDFNQLFPWRSLASNIEYAILKTDKRLTRSEAREMAREALEAVGLSEFHDYYPYQLSGGMKQRGALARALAVRSKILLMDEPFSSLDYDNKEAAYELVKRLHKERGLTIIFVTHDLNEAKALSGKIIYFKDINGKI